MQLHIYSKLTRKQGSFQKYTHFYCIAHTCFWQVMGTKQRRYDTRASIRLIASAITLSVGVIGTRVVPPLGTKAIT